MSDDRIHQYLSDRAATIELRPADPSAVTQRAARRRRNRRGIGVATVVVALGASAVVVTGGGDDPADVVSHASSAASVTESPFDWSLVEPTTGLAFSKASALTDDGAIYSLSTSPGVPESDADWFGDPATLYRSADGAEWAPVALPGDFWASSLAGSGNRLYAVGTGPAGGGSAYRVEVSDDGGATWATTELPTALADLQQRYGDELVTSAPSIAVHDGTVVVIASVAASLDVAARLPEGVGTSEGGSWSPNAGWEITEDGVVLLSGECVAAEASDAVECLPATEPPSASGATTTTLPPADPEAPPTTTVPSEGGGAPATTPTLPSADGDAPTTSTVPAAAPGSEQSYTWAQLGVDDELRDLVLHGRDLLLVSHGGGAFAPVDLSDVASTGGQVVAGDDGFTLFLRSEAPDTAGTSVLRSIDGTTWEPAGELPGYLSSTGVVAGRPAASTNEADGGTVHLAQPDGSWLAVDPLAAVGDQATAEGYVESVAFGPLGWAATVWTGSSTDTEPGARVAVHSVDGTSLSVVPLDDVIDAPQHAVMDVAVTADAVIVRVSDPDGDLTTLTPQSVVVGTPRG